MRRPLKLHPEYTCPAVSNIEVEVVRSGPGTLDLHYSVTGTVEDLLIPPPADPERTDELWQHTCFEAFLRPSARSAYAEVNLSPSRQWATYRFEGYRSDMQDAEFEPPAIGVSRDGTTLNLRATLDFSRLAGFSGKSWDLGVSAVIEEVGGRKSYWALAHPPGKADFHHPDGFVLQLPPAA